MATAEVLPVSDLFPQNFKLSGRQPPAFGESTSQTSAALGVRQVVSQRKSLSDPSLSVLHREKLFHQGSEAKVPGADGFQATLAHSHQLQDGEVQESHKVSWSGGTLRCRDVHCSSKYVEGYFASSCLALRQKSLPRLSNAADVDFSSFKTLPAENPKRPGTEFDSLSPPLKALHEGMVAFGRAQLSDPSNFKLDSSPKMSPVTSDTSSILFLSDLLQDQLRLSTEAGEQGNLSITPDILPHTSSSSRASGRAEEEPCVDPCRGVGAPAMSRDEDNDDVERSPLLLPASIPRAKSILVVKSVHSQACEGRERNMKRVKWRDGHGDLLVSIREFEVSEQPEFYDDYNLEEEGFCSGCCTVS